MEIDPRGRPAGVTEGRGRGRATNQNGRRHSRPEEELEEKGKPNDVWTTDKTQSGLRCSKQRIKKMQFINEGN